MWYTNNESNKDITLNLIVRSNNQMHDFFLHEKVVQTAKLLQTTDWEVERKTGTTNPSNSYLHLQVAIELPYILVQALIYGVLVYAMIGFEWTAAKFFWYLFFMYFTLAYYTFYGMMMVGLTPNYNVSSVASTAFYAIWNLFSGFLIPRTVSKLVNL